MFHALRILDFGIQVATERKIVNYSSVNHYWFAISEEFDYNWESHLKKYVPIYEDLQKRFLNTTK